MTLETEGSLVTFVDEDYSVAIFAAPDEYSSTRSKLKPQWRLSRTPEALVLTHKDGRRLHFGHAVGRHIRLSKISDVHGHDIRFLYDRGTLKWVVLSDEKLIQVHSQHRRIQKLDLQDEDRRFIKTLATYQYDRKGRLLSVRAESGRNFDYQYSKQGWLTRRDDLSNTWVEHDYDDQGRAIATRCAGNYWSDQIRYDDEQLITYYKNAFGGISQYIRDEKNRIIVIVDPEGMGIRSFSSRKCAQMVQH